MVPVRIWAVALFCVLLSTNCVPGSKPPYAVRLYTLDYAFPGVTGERIDQLIRVDRFSVAQSYNSTSMAYRPEPYKFAVYTYHKWRTNPGDMATDYLLRDFRESGLFHAVFSYRQSERTRFTVDGAVEEFVESREPDGWKAILGLEVTLLDTSQPEVTKRVLFQKRYRVSQPIMNESPEAFAAGISGAMARLSAQIIGDVHDSVRRVAAGK